MMSDTSLAPGCFGRALTYRAETPECSSCPFAANCGPISIERTARFRAEMGIAAKVEKPKRPKPEAPASSALAMTQDLPVKVAAIIERIERIERAGLKVTETLARGENPFGVKSIGFMRVACHVLLKRPEGLNRAALTYCLEKQLGWSRATAVAHATQAAQTLTALGATTDSNGHLMLRRSA